MLKSKRELYVNSSFASTAKTADCSEKPLIMYRFIRCFKMSSSVFSVSAGILSKLWMNHFRQKSSAPLIKRKNDVWIWHSVSAQGAVRVCSLQLVCTSTSVFRLSWSRVYLCRCSAGGASSGMSACMRVFHRSCGTSLYADINVCIQIYFCPLWAPLLTDYLADLLMCLFPFHFDVLWLCHSFFFVCQLSLHTDIKARNLVAYHTERFFFYISVTRCCIYCPENW